MVSKSKKFIEPTDNDISLEIITELKEIIISIIIKNPDIITLDRNFYEYTLIKVISDFITDNDVLSLYKNHGIIVAEWTRYSSVEIQEQLCPEFIEVAQFALRKGIMFPSSIKIKNIITKDVYYDFIINHILKSIPNECIRDMSPNKSDEKIILEQVNKAINQTGPKIDLNENIIVRNIFDNLIQNSIQDNIVEEDIRTAVFAEIYALICATYPKSAIP